MHFCNTSPKSYIYTYMYIQTTTCLIEKARWKPCKLNINTFQMTYWKIVSENPQHYTAWACVLYVGTFVIWMKYHFSMSVASKWATLLQWLHKLLTNKPRKVKQPHAAPLIPLPREAVGFQTTFQAQSFGADIHHQEPNSNKSNPDL